MNRIAESLFGTPETNVTLHVNYTGMKKNKPHVNVYVKVSFFFIQWKLPRFVNQLH